MEALRWVLYFILVVGVLVTVHEFGHFWVARRLGVKVLRFSVGFGSPLWLHRAGPDQTEYVIAAIPLGGYVKMLDEREGEVAEADLPRAFNRQRLWVRVAVVLAGPVANLLFAVLVYWLMFGLGVSGIKPIVGEVRPDSIAAQAGFEVRDEIVGVADREVRTWERVIHSVVAKALAGEPAEVHVRRVHGAKQDLRLDLGSAPLDDLAGERFFRALGLRPLAPRAPPGIAEVMTGTPAEAGGLKAGDQITHLDGTEVEGLSALVNYVNARPGQPITLRVRRDGVELEMVVTPRAEERDGRTIGLMGVKLEEVPKDVLETFYAQYRVVERYGPIDSLGRALSKTVEMCGLTLTMLWKMLAGQVSVENLSGPITIAQFAASSAQQGVAHFLNVLGLISIGLGILNLLPIPVLDGGHLMYYCIELFKGRPVSDEALLLGQRVGLAMLFGLMGLAFYNDLARLFG